MSELVSEETIAAVERMEARQVQEMRLAVVREICNREGHGELIEVTMFGERIKRSVCQRGCGITVLRLEQAETWDELTEYLERRKLSGEVRLRGTVEVS